MWERIEDNSLDSERLKTYGGWIVRSHMCDNRGNVIDQIFVADPEHEWKL